MVVLAEMGVTGKKPGAATAGLTAAVLGVQLFWR